MDAQWIFEPARSFTEKALQLFRFQYQHNSLYQRFARALNCEPAKVQGLEAIPFLPISFFKTAAVQSTQFEPQAIFESSGTSGQQTSRHTVKSTALYEQSFLTAFEAVYGPVTNYCILGLLPSYLERGSSSLVYMVQKLIEKSGHPQSGFYLYNFDALAQTLRSTEIRGQQVLLIGVTYALLDFAQAFPMKLKHAVVMETGGMKGRRKELLRAEVHQLLRQAFGVPQVHSEYGMTELLSQAYAQYEGRFRTPAWMRVLLREEDDPLALTASVTTPRSGGLNVIDLANIYSCAFIATDDVARLHPDGSFEVLGRLDGTDLRGCSLLAL